MIPVEVTPGTDMEAILLVGGLGTRLRRELGVLPKAMVDVGGRPFLEHMLTYLRGSNVRSIILAVSYGREYIESYFGDGAALGVSIQYCREAEPLGTAGAVRNALSLTHEDYVVVINGDSFVDINYEDLFNFHRMHRKRLTIVGVRRPDCRDFGRLQISDKRITAFLEKDLTDRSPGYVNGGVYVFDRMLIESICPGIVQSLEKQFFPSLLSSGEHIPVYLVDKYFIDLGTPDRLERFRRDFSQDLVRFGVGE